MDIILAQAGGASAGELGASHPAFHPVAADLNQLASGVQRPDSRSLSMRGSCAKLTAHAACG